MKRIDIVFTDEVDPILVDCADEVAELIMTTQTILSGQAPQSKGQDHPRNRNIERIESGLARLNERICSSEADSISR